MQFCGFYPHFLHTLVIELSKNADPTLTTYHTLSRAAIQADSVEQLLLIMDEMLGRGMKLNDGLIKHAVRMLCEWGLPRLAVGLVDRAEKEVGNKVETAAWAQILQSSAESQYVSWL